MKYTDDHKHLPILGKAGDFVDILSRVPAETEIVLDGDNFRNCFSPCAVEISLEGWHPLEHIITLQDDGSLKQTLVVNAIFSWNRRDHELTCAEMFQALLNLLHNYGDGYDTRKIPAPESLGKTVANNRFAFLDMLGEFQKKYRGKVEKKEQKK